MERHRKRWTEQERMRAQFLITNERLSTVAKRMGRSPLGVWRAIGGSIHHHIDGMTAIEVSNVLGVDRHTVLNWIKRGQLETTLRWIVKSQVHTISYEAITTLLMDHGYALSKVVKPTHPIWREIVNEIRDELLQDYVNALDIGEMLHIRFFYARMRRYHEFPEPCFSFGSRGGGRWFRRADVVRWLNEHPGYWTQTAAEEFEQVRYAA